MKILRMCNAQIQVELILCYSKLAATVLLVERGVSIRAIFA